MHLKDNFAGLCVTAAFKPDIDPQQFPTRDTRPADFLVYLAFAYSECHFLRCCSAQAADLQALEENPDFWKVDINELMEPNKDCGYWPNQSSQATTDDKNIYLKFNKLYIHSEEEIKRGII